MEDVAHGHLLAAERGAVGRSYILGGENLDPPRGAGHSGRGHRAPGADPPGSRARWPWPPAWVSDVVEGRLLRREPSIPLEGAKMSTTHMSFDDSRARHELGYTSRPAAEALARAAHWFVDAGYVRPDRSGTLPTGRREACTIVIGSDHAGFPLKGPLIQHLEGGGHQVDDIGTFSTEPVDYPPICADVARRASRATATSASSSAAAGRVRPSPPTRSAGPGGPVS